jgi:hypothetical protein
MSLPFGVSVIGLAGRAQSVSPSHPPIA